MLFLSFYLLLIWLKRQDILSLLVFPWIEMYQEEKNANFQGLKLKIISFGQREYLMNSDLGNKTLV